MESNIVFEYEYVIVSEIFTQTSGELDNSGNDVCMVSC